ncbi:ribosomal protein s21 domain-containing protein [Sarocladium implicatum]|nr:ribosomal protein s21 domain-containing protein [Sarocladium implicatum]
MRLMIVEDVVQVVVSTTTLINFKGDELTDGSHAVSLFKMASRATLAVLPRRAPSTLVLARPFSHSIVYRAKSSSSSNDAPIRHNPLIGNYKPPTPAPTASDASVSTEKPGATKTPSPDRSPVSSAEVAPNADLPPRPPPAASPAAAQASLAKSASPYAYDATRSTPSKPSGTTNILSFLNERQSIHNLDVQSSNPLDRPKVRTEAVTGRTIFVKNSFGPNTAPTGPQAINSLNMLVKKQGIKSKFHYQRFHERRGMKKKRLRMERWRKQFKAGFRETVKRVMELKRQGW